jgi:UDP-N-acetylglucosamine acyltransferase
VKIHPTAIVEDGARLGAEVEVGAYAIVGGNAVLGGGCRVQAHAVITGHVTMGERNFVGYGAVIGAAPQDFAFDESSVSEVRIGDGNVFREYVTIHRGTKEGTATLVGDGNFVMTGAHFGHNVRVGDRTVIANNCLLAGYAEIQDGAVLGGGTVFHQHMRVGRLCMVRGGARFGKDIPPFTVADGENIISGLNAVGLKRTGFPSETRLELKRLFRLIFCGRLNVSQALDAARAIAWGPEALEMIEFIAGAKKRGVCSGPRGRAAEAAAG